MTYQEFIKELKSENSPIETKVENVYYYIRDKILFDFLPEIDDIEAEEVFNRGRGQCNNKTILFFEIMKELNLESRVHFSTISKEIHRGLFPSILFFFTPNQIGHSWLEVNINGKWIQFDGYINDQWLYRSALKKNNHLGLQTGHSVSSGECGASMEFSLNSDNFVQMNAVTRSLGTTTDPMAWLKDKSKNPNQVNFVKKILYRLFLPLMRRNVEKTRNYTS